MKTRKLLAMLVAVAMIVTMLPVVAFAAEDEEPAGPAVPDASRIYASDDEVDADGEDEVTITVRLRDSDGNVATGLATGEKLYVWAERSEDRISRIDTVVSTVPDDEVVTGENSLVTFSNAAGEVEVTYTSSFDGEVKFWFAICEIGDEDDFEEKLFDNKAGYVAVEFEGTMEDYELKLKGLKPVDDNGDLVLVKANGIDNYEVVLQLVGDHNLPVKGEQVNFDTSSSRMVLNKDSAVTDSNGVVKVKATSERAGEYTLYAELDSDRSVELLDDDGDEGIVLEFIASAAYDIKVKKGDGAVVALDEAYTFEFEVFDIFGRLIKGGDWDEYGIEVDVPTAPDKANFEDTAEDDDNWEWEENANFKVKARANDLDEEGEYVLRVKLGNGKYATASFEVKEQGEIVDMTVEYDPAYTSEDEDEEDEYDNLYTKEPTVKIIDAEGIEAEASNKDLEFSVSNTRIARIHDNGVVEQRNSDSEGIVTVTVVNNKHNVVATTEVRIGDVGAAGIDFDVPETLLVGEDYTIGMKVLDEDGKKIMKDAEYSAVVLSKPDDAKVEVDVYEDEMVVYSDTKGEVKIIVTAREEENNQAISSTLTLNFVTEPVKPAAGKVVLTIGANFGLVDGAVTDLDAPAFIAEGRTFVPVRFIAEALGAEADWEPKDAAVETVFLTWDDMEITIGIGDEFLTVTRDGEAEVLTFDGAARIVDGRTYLPFRAIGEAIGLEVDYGPKDGPVEWVSFE